MITLTGAVTTVRFQVTNSINGSQPPDTHNSPPQPRTPLLSLPKPSWIVKTQSNVRIEKRQKPDPPCVVCRGSGRVDCFDCSGKGHPLIRYTKKLLKQKRVKSRFKMYSNVYNVIKWTDGREACPKQTFCPYKLQLKFVYCLVGRTNGVDLAMLPNGEWPKWCKTCGGSGLAYCSRCLGTGEYRYLMGFHFMKKDEDAARGNITVRDMLRTRKSAEDLLPNDEIS